VALHFTCSTVCGTALARLSVARRLKTSGRLVPSIARHPVACVLSARHVCGIKCFRPVKPRTPSLIARESVALFCNCSGWRCFQSSQGKMKPGAVGKGILKAPLEVFGEPKPGGSHIPCGFEVRGTFLRRGVCESQGFGQHSLNFLCPIS
jgi:hypothetical protein